MDRDDTTKKDEIIKNSNFDYIKNLQLYRSKVTSHYCAMVPKIPFFVLE